jgi:hypothetical protein
MNYFSSFLLKNACSLIAFVFIFSVTEAQTSTAKVNPKVLEALGAERVSSLQQISNDSVLFYNFLVENSFKVIKKETLSSNINYNSLAEIKINDSWIVNGKVDFIKFNVLMVPVKPDQIKSTYYRIAGSDYVLLLKSMDYNFKKFEGYKSFQK